METIEHQEMRARQRLSPRAIVYAALAAGGVTFIMSGGSPWSTGAPMSSIMGRVSELHLLLRLVLHLVIAFVYAGVIAAVVYRFRMVAALAAGVGLALALYAANYAIFYAFGGRLLNYSELQPAFCHFTFAMIATVVYKGASVPRPLEHGPRDPGPGTAPAPHGPTPQRR